MTLHIKAIELSLLLNQNKKMKSYFIEVIGETLTVVSHKLAKKWPGCL